jgi:tripartite-type tricarboxylate transporter receptor subunit TctC
LVSWEQRSFAAVSGCSYAGSLFAPRGTPKPVIDHIAQASRTAMAELAYQQKMLNAGYRPDADSTSEKLQGYIRDDLDRWAPLIKQIGLKLD